MEIVNICDNFDVLINKTNSNITHVCLMFDIGSRSDGLLYSGVVHFIEHMLFKGTINMKCQQILESIEIYGADFNAYTTKEELCIHISVLNCYVKEILCVLGDLFSESTFPEEEVDREREVIIEEILSYEDSPSDLIFDVFEEYSFHGCDMALPVLGNQESLNRIDSVVLREFYYNKIFKSRTVLTFWGDVDVSIVETIRKVFIKRSINAIAQNENHVKPFFNHFRKKIFKDTNQSHCVLGIEAPNWSNAHRYEIMYLSNVLGGGFSSSLLNMSLRENNGLAYTVESIYTPYSDTGLFQIYFGADKKKVASCIDEIQNVFKKITDKDFLDENFNAYKNRFIGQLAISYENNLNIALSTTKSLIATNSIISYNNIVEKIEIIEIDSLYEFAKNILDIEKMSSLEFC